MFLRLAVLGFLLAGLLPAHSARADEWRPAPQVAEAARRAAEAYLVAEDVGDAGVAWTMQTEGLQAVSDIDAYRRSVASFRVESGPLVSRDIYRTTWYKDPPDSPGPGLYVAFDLTARYQNVERYCGYLIAFQPPQGGPFRIMRSEKAFMSNESARAISEPDNVWASTATAYCPGWQPERST